MTRHAIIDSPIGPLTLVAREDAAVGIYMSEHRHQPVLNGARDDTVLPDLRAQLQAYFTGDLVTFEVTTLAVGTPFQERVWQGLARIPYGQTWSYRHLAQEIGSPAAVRAVGLANGKNPLSIVVPCHRVVGANGNLTGYGGGLIRKQFLLSLEAATVASGTQPGP